MDKEILVAVSRMRRRLSVESEDVQSPAAQLTPTKKRGGRLAAKPQLELIDENATENVPKRTRKSTVKDVESVNEKPVTPSRRSSRIKSNTSIVSETPSVEASDEKPMTPARRSTRIRSNTSLISETTQNYDSPRAKRAARRNSQVGSDNEAPVTPARQTRRTRKDSASSVDKAEINTGKVINEVITEETETNVKEKKSPKSDSSPRKSPRLKLKTSKKMSTSDINKNESLGIALETYEETALPTTPADQKSLTTAMNFEDLKQNDNIKSENSDKKNLSINSTKLLEQMDTVNKKSNSKLNKTTSIVEELKQYKSKRHRTKSCSLISGPSSNDGSFCSDNEISKRKNKRGSNNFNIGKKVGAGDDLFNTDVQINKENKQNNAVLTSIEKTKKRFSEKNLTTEESNQSVNLDNITAEILTENKNIVLNSTDKETMNETEKLFEQAPSSIVRSMVYIDDSDSNTGSVGKENKVTLFDGGDQCVPVVEHQLDEEALEQKNSVSCEPMDIDETVPENTLSHFAEKETDDPTAELEINEKQKSSICIPKENVSINETVNKSNRKSSGITEVLNLDNTENKSTLVLSQIKDFSSNEINENNTSKTKEPLSISVNGSSTASAIEKKNVSVNYSTSTPLQQKTLKTLGIQLNTSIITPNSKTIKDKNTPKEPKNQTSGSTQKNDSDSDSYDVVKENSEDETTKESKLIDDEAEEASDDYESGDSRDEEEKRYEEDNEIHEKGETLNSDDEQECSDDSEYEKGSFIVSSDEEDHNLLSGSGDDLSMSADELSMSAKSKKKYNERKLREQKKASQEIFQARHKLNKSDENTKSKKSKQNKYNRLESSDSEQDINVQKNINRRQRIDSNKDVSIDNSLLKNKKKTKRLSDSICDDTSEKEMTVCEDIDIDNNDPLSVQNEIKKEPKTPQNGLDISTVQVTHIDEIEEIHVNENVTMTNVNETSDPLQATTLQNGDEDDDVESISENEEITQNYDSLLNDLNNVKAKKIKSLDMSLNIDKKPKQKSKDPVIDELNLTQTKKSKKNKKITLESAENDPPVLSESNNEQKKDKSKTDIHNEDSSDSIDMKLLFPEESNDSEASNDIIQSKDAKETLERDDDANNMVDDFIPLKRTNAKTNILENIESKQPEDSELNKSKKKNKKNKSAQHENMAISNENENDVSFFIDTTGTHSDELDTTSTLNKSSNKKNKNKRNRNLEANFDEINDTDSDLQKKRDVDIATNEKLLSVENNSLANTEDIGHCVIGSDKTTDVSIKNNEKKNNENKSYVEEGEDKSCTNTEISNIQSAKKNKKKKESKLNTSEMQNNENISLDLSINSVSGKNKKVDSFVIDHINNEISEVDISFNKKIAKKTKKNSISMTSIEGKDQIEDTEDVHEVVESNKKSNKKNKNTSMTLEDKENKEDEISESMGQSKKKKKNKNKLETSQPHVDETDKDLESVEQSKNKEDKIKDTSQHNVDETDIVLESIEQNKKTKIKTKLNKSQHTIDDTEVIVENAVELSLSKDVSNKKKKKKISDSQTSEQIEDEYITTNEQEVSQKQNRKRKSSANQTLEEIVIKDPNTSNNSTTYGAKKRKLSSNDQEITTQNQEIVKEIHEEITNKKSKKKNKNKQTSDTIQSNKDNNTHKDVAAPGTNDGNQSHLGKNKINKKRKERDDDDNDKTSKILKQHSSDKIHVPRLPTNILKQLDDVPNKEVLETKKAKVISTTQFVVEESKKRKNKPSNYLEQSVYLNDTLEDKKKKAFIKTPKVLPFLPTASTSDCGFTTKFRVNVVPQEPQFVAQSNDVPNFKQNYLNTKKMKKLGTFEKYKKQRNVKLAKF